MAVPGRFDLLVPILMTLCRLGGMADLADLERELARCLDLTSEDMYEPQDDKRTRLHFEMQWALSHLNGYGAVTNSARGYWAVTAKGRELARNGIHEAELDQIRRALRKPSERAPRRVRPRVVSPAELRAQLRLAANVSTPKPSDGSTGS